MKYKKFVEAQKVEVDDEDKTMVDTKKKNTDKKEDPAATKTPEKEKKKKEEEEALEEDTMADIKRWFSRNTKKKQYEKVVRLFLDLRKKNPGKAGENLRKVAQMTGADIRTIDKVLRDMVKDGAMPKHLLNYPSLQVEAKSGDKEAYQKFFQATLKKFGVKSPAELDDKKEKEFYNYIDKNWKSDDEEVDEATMADRQVLKAVRVAKDMAGNHTGATKRIEAMKKGLSDHPKVKAALQQYNESVEEASAPKIKMNRGPWTMREISDALKDVKMTGRQKDSFIYALKTGSSDEPRLGKKMLKGPFSKKDVDAAMKKSGLDKSLKRGQFGLALQKVGLDMFGNKIKEGTEYATFAERTEMRMGDLKAKIQHYKTTDGMTEADLEALATRLGISAVKLRTLLDEEE